MSLVRDNEIFNINETNLVEIDAAVSKWQHWPFSTISHHEQSCCRIARDWILAMDYAQLNAGHALTGPRWIRHKYKWGPSSWPIHWCEAVRQETLDCGALAALAHEVFTARGVRSFPAQFIQQFSEDATCQWYERWGGDRTTVHWIKEDLIYHEGCAILIGDDELKVWDASAGWWVNPKQFSGYGGLLAIRIFDPQTTKPTSYTWGPHAITTNVWQKVGSANGDFA